MSEFVDPFAEEEIDPDVQAALDEGSHLSVTEEPSGVISEEVSDEADRLLGRAVRPPGLRYPEPSLENARKDANAAVFLAAWGEEVFLASAYFKAWEAEWRHQCISDAGLPDDAGLTKKPK